MGNVSAKKAMEETPAEVQAEPEKQAFTCEICFESLPSDKRFNNRGMCFHRFCIDCVAKYIQVRVEEDRVADVKCPELNCEKVLDPFTCKSMVVCNVFEKWCDLLCEKATLGFERCYCPNLNCSALIVSECGGNVKRSKCPNCKKLFCFTCKLPWHAGYRCGESGEMRDRNDIEFGILAERMKWARCPQCNHCIELRDGCAIVRCRCGVRFCYTCGRKVHLHACFCTGTRAALVQLWRTVLIVFGCLVAWMIY
ncbi:hypothetical protein NMG60_11015480, partial [Bertholletia excelsa]